MFEVWFSKFANATARTAGHPFAFSIAVAIVLVWAVTGPLFHFSDTWQLVINTGTTIVTFLMVFLIQNSQNRDSIAMQLKLDEIIRAQVGAANKMLDVEQLSYEDLERICILYEHLAAKARERETTHGDVDTGCGDLDLKNIDNEIEKKKRKAS
jgi:low affinity Fe/Cu permease